MGPTVWQGQYPRYHLKVRGSSKSPSFVKSERGLRPVQTSRCEFAVAQLASKKLQFFQFFAATGYGRSQQIHSLVLTSQCDHIW